MIAAHEWFAGEAIRLWPGLADHLWQSTLFALVILLASLALRRGPAKFRHSLWLLASAKFVVPAALFFSLAQQAGINPSWFFQPAAGSQMNLLHGITEPASAFANGYQITVGATTIGHWELYCVLTLIWLTGSTTFLGVWWMRRQKFLRALREGAPIDAGERGRRREWEALERARESLRWDSPVGLVISAHKTEPAVCGVWKPVVLLPQAIADHLDDAELEAIMLHELIHIQRRDNLIGNLQMMISALLWFHPLVWFIGNKLFDERELACDEEVLKIRGAPEAYASSILKVVRFSLGWRVAGVTGAGSGSNLRRRIENIMSTNNTKRSSTGWHRLLAGTLVGFAFVLMVVAGVYTRARDVSAAVNNQTVQETSAVAVSEVNDLVAPADSADGKDPKIKAAKQQPPEPPQPPQVSQPPQAPQPPKPPQRESDAATPAPPTPPTAPAATTPASAPLPPTPPAKEKSKSKSKDKEKNDQDKVEKGELIEAPQPVYPTEARAQQIEGEVKVVITIGDEGNVISAKPTSGHELLQDAAKDAAYKARFKPTRVNGKPVKVSGVLSYAFVLDKK